MKTRITFFLFLLMMILKLQAQVVTENADFNFYQSALNNDFINHFSGGNGLTQIQTTGITGGCLATPDSINWGNDNAYYCTKYKPNLLDTTVTNICFLYDSAAVHPNSFQRGLSVWLVPHSDFNHYIIATVNFNKKLELLTYSWNNNPYPNLALQNNHWYNYQLSVAFIGGANHSVFIKAEVFDLGLTGISSPAFVNSSSGTINDSTLCADTSIQVGISGALYGGVSYLDNFSIHGRKGQSNCVDNISGINFSATTGINVFPSIASSVIHVSVADLLEKEITVFNVEGKIVFDRNTVDPITNIDVSLLPNGIYLVRCKTKDIQKDFKIVVNR